MVCSTIRNPTGVMIDFFNPSYQTRSEKKRFGICDTPPPPSKPAYMDEGQKGQDWIAIVENQYQTVITFTPIDNRIEIRKSDGTMDSRCDGLLFYDSVIIFVELKQSNVKGNAWIKKGEEQLRATIGYFEQTPEAENYKYKRAYIANSEKPRFRKSQTSRMDKFLVDTGYILRIENRIIINK
jgi:hypothetical protein